MIEPSGDTYLLFRIQTKLLWEFLHHVPFACIDFGWTQTKHLQRSSHFNTFFPLLAYHFVNNTSHFTTHLLSIFYPTMKLYVCASIFAVPIAVVSSNDNEPKSACRDYLRVIRYFPNGTSCVSDNLPNHYDLSSVNITMSTGDFLKQHCCAFGGGDKISYDNLVFEQLRKFTANKMWAHPERVGHVFDVWNMIRSINTYTPNIYNFHLHSTTISCSYLHIRLILPHQIASACCLSCSFFCSSYKLYPAYYLLLVYYANFFSLYIHMILYVKELRNRNLCWSFG